jgi:hypothetical protein
VALGGTTAGTGYDQLIGTGSVNLTGATLNLSLALANGFTPAPLASFDIFVNNGGAAISGTFAGLPEGANFSVGAVPFTITYKGGTSHHDVVLTVPNTTTAPSITTQPSSVTVSAGSSAQFTAVATGFPVPTVQWYVNRNDGNGYVVANGATTTPVSGGTSTTYSIASTTSTMNGYEYEAIFSNGAGMATTNAAALTVDFAPSITTQPTNQTLIAGTMATFTAAAAGNPAATVQWYVNKNDGNGFVAINGATSATYSTGATTAAMGGYQYDAIFTNNLGMATTNAVSLTVDSVPAISMQPSNQLVVVGHNATFTAAAGSTPSPTVQWYVSTNGGTTFVAIAGATATTLTVPAVQFPQSGYEYEAIFTNPVGSATSSAATLTARLTL